MSRKKLKTWRPFDRLAEQIKNLPVDVRKEILIANRDLALKNPPESYYSEVISTCPVVLQTLIWQLSDPRPEIKSIIIDNTNILSIWNDVDELLHLKKLMSRMGEKEDGFLSKSITSTP